ncbi:MAG: hypothetical protein JKY09_02040 [Crocinitomicaceae bacterium]|nr:hypothetical protein [Crocinitomicaceae bacterium]
MKATFLSIAIALVSFGSMAQETDSLGLEGDNLDLNAVLEVFKDSESPEDFEKRLNSKDNDVNNLDLNGDGEVDYIRVVDHGDSVSHALTLQVPVNETEYQDVAVIEIEEIDEETVNLQVIGDSELYGEDYMVEPADEKNVNVVVNVRTWRPVRHLYAPKYVLWVSPWRYGVYPKWHRPGKRVAWGVYHKRVHHHHRHYRRVHHHRLHRAHAHYHKHRVHSATFHAKHHHKHTPKKAHPQHPVKKHIQHNAVKKKMQSPAVKTKSDKQMKTKPVQNSRKRPGATKKSGTNTKKRSGGQRTRGGR